MECGPFYPALTGVGLILPPWYPYLGVMGLQMLETCT